MHANHRAAMIAGLAAGMQAALAAGDTEAARIAHEAIGRLLGGAGAAAASVVDLGVRRRITPA